MANSVTTQILEEGPRNVIVKLAGVLDTSDYSLSTALDMSTLNQGGKGPTPDTVRIDHIDYSISDPLEVRLLWDGTPQLDILPLAGRGRMSFWNFGGLQNNATSPTGKIALQTTGYSTGTLVFSVVLELVKQGV